MNLKRTFFAFALQGAALSGVNLVLSLFVVTGLNGNVKNASIAIALFSTGNLVGSIASSMVLDRLKSFSRLVFGSLFGSALLTILIAFVPTIKIYYLIALLLGAVVALVGPALTFHLSKTLDDLAYRKGINYLNLFNSVGQTTGMLLGSLILAVLSSMKDPSKMRSVFISSAILLVVASITVAEREREMTIRRKPSIYTTKLLFTKVVRFPKKFFDVLNIRKLDKRARVFMIAVFISFFGANILFSVFSIYLKLYLKLSSQSVFLLYAINSIAANGAFYLTGLINDRAKDKLFVRAVLIIRAMLFLLMAAVGYFHFKFSSAIVFVSFVIIGFSWPFFYVPLSVEIVKLGSPASRGRIIGFFNISINIAVISASFVAGYIALKLGYVATFGIGAFFLIIGEIAFSRVLSKRE